MYENSYCSVHDRSFSNMVKKVINYMVIPEAPCEIGHCFLYRENPLINWNKKNPMYSSSTLT